MNDALHLSDAGANLIKHFEGCLRPVGNGRFQAYRCPAKVLTIGWGHTNPAGGRQFKAGAVWTQAECDTEFRSDMRAFEKQVKRLVKVKLAQYQFDALTSFTFNCGQGNFGKSTLLRKVNNKEFEAAAQEFHKWNKGRGKVLKGLVRRRASESLLFQNIRDSNYNGKPDYVITPPDEPMPHEVDAPEMEAA